MRDTATAQTHRLQVGLGTLLATVTLLTVLVTAALVYVPWYLTATRNISDTVRELDRQISSQVASEIERLFSSAQSSVQALRTVLFQRVISSTDAAKREFLFLAHLESDPSLTWVSFGFPNGDFFGAYKPRDGGVKMVETQWDAEKKRAILRVDHYESSDGDIWFQRRETGTSELFAPDLPWYRAGVALGEATRATWTDIHALPIMDEYGISAAVPLRLFDKPVGVVSVSVGLSRISAFLNTLPAVRSGNVFVVDRGGALVAAKTDTTAGSDAGIIRLQLALSRVAQENVNLATLNKVIQLEVEDLNDAKLFVGLSPVRKGTDSATSWTVITVIPAADFVAAIDENNRQLAILLALFVTLIAFAAVVISGFAIDRPLSRIVAQLRHIEAFRLDRVSSTPSRVRELAFLSSALLQMTQGLSGFVRYLPTELVQALVARGQEDRPQVREATILYLDLQGFTRIGEQLSPQALVELLNEFFSLVYAHIKSHGGAVLQFQGDAILAAFNVPNDCEEHRRQAVLCALAIDAQLQTHQFSGEIKLAARIGLNSGNVIAGTVGSAERANYTIHGDAVNLAARLEAMNKHHHSRILASANTVEGLKSTFTRTPLGDVEVRGKQSTVTIYRLA